jgi:hypothetical protein
MADIVFVLIAVAFFALCGLYIRGCERILRSGDESDQGSDLTGDVTV